MAGRIEKLDRNKWKVRFFLKRDANGKRIYLSKTIHGTKRDADAYLLNMLRERALGNLDAKLMDSSARPVEVVAVPSLGEFVQTWIDERARHTVRAATLDSYETIFQSYLRDFFAIPISEIDSAIIERHLRDLLAKGLSPRTVTYAHRVLSLILEYGVIKGHIAINPCARVKPPKKVKKEMGFFSPEELKRFLAEASSDRYFVLFLLAAETGMRPSEYLGLKWTDFDFDSRRIKVRRALKKKPGGDFYFAPPKNQSSERNIFLSPYLAGELQKLKLQQDQESTEFKINHSEWELIFVNTNGGPIAVENLKNRHFFRILKKAGLKRIRLYDLRHTTATILLEGNTHPNIVAERLGHSQPHLTMSVYSHVRPTMQEHATETFRHMVYGKGEAE